MLSRMKSYSTLHKPVQKLQDTLLTYLLPSVCFVSRLLV